MWKNNTCPAYFKSCNRGERKCYIFVEIIQSCGVLKVWVALDTLIYIV